MSGGFMPAQRLNGGAARFPTRRFQKSTAGNDASLIYVGDPLRLNTDGTVQRLLATDVSATGISSAYIGVAARFFSTEKGRPKVHSLTAGNHPDISNTADADWLDVYVDPDIIYEVNADTSAAQSLIGQAVTVKMTARNTACGGSGSRIDTTVSASNVWFPFKVVGISPKTLDTRVGATDGRILVIANNHAFKVTTTY